MLNFIALNTSLLPIAEIRAFLLKWTYPKDLKAVNLKLKTI